MNAATTKKNPILTIRSGLKAGSIRISLNHSRSLQVRSGLKGGRLSANHNRRLAG